jgi:hypothetical protein
MAPRSILLFVFLLTVSLCTGQVDDFLFDNAAAGLGSPDLKLLNEGKNKMLQEEYTEAAAIFEEISVKDQVFVNYLKGICYSHDVDNRDKGLQLIRAAGSRSAEINGYDYNLAFALMKNDSVNAAKTWFRKALAAEEQRSSRNSAIINEIRLSIEHCNTVLEFKARRNLVKISSIGPPVNTSAHEYCPLIPSNDDYLVYTYRGPGAKGGKQKIKGSKLRDIEDIELFFEDIFIARKLNDSTWDQPEGIDNLNTGSHDAAVSLNADGSEMMLYKNRGKGKGDLFLSRLEGSTWTKPEYQAKLNSTEWDGSACFLPGQNVVIISSERKGGYGGKDLYYAERLSGNTWGNIRNLGPHINSRYDEDAPFVTSDGQILFFSSNNRFSLGGYDIFRSDLVNGEWTSPYNLGPPINTTNDDNYFTVRADGKVGYYSSQKKGGDGGQDIYKVEPGIPGKPVTMLQVDGLVTIDGKPAQATIDIKSTGKGKTPPYKVNSNKVTGKFLANLPAGHEYELEVNAEKFPPQYVLLNTTAIDSFVVLNVYTDFISPSYENQVGKAKSAEGEQLKQDSVFDKRTFSGKFGEQRRDSLYFTVQIAAYKFANKFNYNAIVGLPKVEKQTGSDKVSRFTMGRFNTYNEAQVLLKQVQATISDAFITAVYRGERKLLFQLVDEKIIGTGK